MAEPKGAIGRPSLFSKSYLIDRQIRRQLLRARRLVHGRLIEIGRSRTADRSLLADGCSRYVSVDRTLSAIDGFAPVDVLADCCCLALRAGCAGAVLCSRVLNYIADPDLALRECYRVLAPGGHLLLIAVQSWRISADPVDYYRFTGDGLRYLLARAGFEVVSVDPMGGFWSNVGMRLVVYLAERCSKLGPLRLIAAPLIASLNLAFVALDALHYVAGDTAANCAIARRSDPGMLEE